MVCESAIPVSRTVKGACGMLGLDPFYMANEGKMVIFADSERAEAIVADLRSIDEAREAAIIGETCVEPAGMVLLETELGAQRILGMLEGEHLPRIC
jgi:hydrogenase expression/formation protein HypE